MGRTVFMEKCEEKIETILDLRDKISSLQMSLESEKESLLSLMRENNTYEYFGATTSAKIITFNRESLVKDEVITTIAKVNAGQQNEKIKLHELMKVSPVCFVLVKGLE